MIHKNACHPAGVFNLRVFKFQFVVLFKSALPGNDYHCHCEERSDVAISW